MQDIRTSQNSSSLVYEHDPMTVKDQMVKHDLTAQNFLAQERAKYVFESQAKTSQKFLSSKYDGFGPDKQIKKHINSKFMQQ